MDPNFICASTDLCWWWLFACYALPLIICLNFHTMFTCYYSARNKRWLRACFLTLPFCTILTIILSSGFISLPNDASHTTIICVFVIAPSPCLYWLRNSCWDRISRIGSTAAPRPNCATTMSEDIFRIGFYLEAALQRHVVMPLPILWITYQNNQPESSELISTSRWCELGCSVMPPIHLETGLLEQNQVQECNGNSTFRFEWRFCQIRQAPHHSTVFRPAIESCQSQCRKIVDSEKIPCIAHWSMIALFFHGHWAISAVWTWWNAELYQYQACFAKARLVCSLSHRSERIDASVYFVRVQVFVFAKHKVSLLVCHIWKYLSDLGSCAF